MKHTGITARGIKLPIIKKGDDLVKITADCIMETAKSEGIEFKDKDIVAITESLLARSQGNFVSIQEVADEVNEKFPEAKTLGFIFPITSRNRVSAMIRAMVLTGKNIIVQLQYPNDEMGNHMITIDDLETHNVNPYIDVIDEKKWRKLFGYPVLRETGVDYLAYYKSIVGENGAVIFANNPRAILKYTKYVINADVHTRERTKRILKEAGAKTVYSVRDLCNTSRNGSGYNADYGLLGSNLSTETVLKLFPHSGDEFVKNLQTELEARTGKIIECMIYGDGAFKDPTSGIWELYDPVVSPAFTSGLGGSPNELKLKFIADNETADMNQEDAKKHIEEKIKNKDSNLVGKKESLGTTPRQYTDLIGSLADLISGSGDKGTPVVLIQNYFGNYTN